MVLSRAGFVVIAGFLLSSLILTLIITRWNKGDSGDALDSLDQQSRWGYAEVRPGVNLFWWLYFTTVSSNFTAHPLVLWIEGGPGMSGTGSGNFDGVGPLELNLRKRDTAWTQHANVLFVDSPVGAGFSYAVDPELLCKSNKRVVDDLIELIKHVFTIVPELQVLPLHIFGNSYGGKIAALLAQSLVQVQAVDKGASPANLKSVTLGVPWISPVDIIQGFGPVLHTMSVIDDAGLAKANLISKGLKDAYETQNYAVATNYFWDVVSHSREAPYNVIKDLMNRWEAKEAVPLEQLMNGKVKKALKIEYRNVTWKWSSGSVFNALVNTPDHLASAVPAVEYLLENVTGLNVNVYVGQLDVMVNAIGTMKWVQQMKWTGLKDWNKAERAPLYRPGDNGTKVAYMKSFKNFTFYWLLNCGHWVAHDAPEVQLQIFRRILGIASGT